MPTFNLIDEPWIPVRPIGDAARPREVGLREALADAHRLGEISDASPLVVVALHRLLLAIVHRVFGPADVDAWSALWERGRFDAGRLTGYLEAHRQRFDLFDDAWPFYQVPTLGIEYAVPVARLAHELAPSTGNALFNHGVADASFLVPAKAARYLVAHQAFAVGGLITYEKGQDPRIFKSADAAPLTKGAVVLARGASIFQTLLLNLVQYSRRDEMPFAFRGEDLAAWERQEYPRAEDRAPDGYVDLLTWQSRRIRLFPAEVDGKTVVDRVVIMKGNQFPDGFERRAHETMLAFRKVEKPAKGQEPWPVISFQEGRALWRDSAALFQSVADHYLRPKTLDWLSVLSRQDAVERAKTIPLDVLGLSVDRAKVFLWRHEHLPLPLEYLENRELFGSFREALKVAEDGASALRSAAFILATYLESANADLPTGRQPRTEDVRPVAESLGLDRRYWPSLDGRFRELLSALPRDPNVDGAPRQKWLEDVRQAAIGAFQEVANSLDGSARTLKAVALAQRRLYSQLPRGAAATGAASPQ